MLQHERTALAWERTAISAMVAGVLFARFAARDVHVTVASIGIAQVVLGGLLLIWAGRHYDDLHAPLRAGQSPVHPRAAQIIGLSTVTFIAVALGVAVIASLK